MSMNYRYITNIHQPKTSKPPWKWEFLKSAPPFLFEKKTKHRNVLTTKGSLEFTPNSRWKKNGANGVLGQSLLSTCWKCRQTGPLQNVCTCQASWTPKVNQAECQKTEKNGKTMQYPPDRHFFPSFSPWDPKAEVPSCLFRSAVRPGILLSFPESLQECASCARRRAWVFGACSVNYAYATCTTCVCRYTYTYIYIYICITWCLCLAY